MLEPVWRRFCGAAAGFLDTDYTYQPQGVLVQVLGGMFIAGKARRARSYCQPTSHVVGLTAPQVSNSTIAIWSVGSRNILSGRGRADA